MKTQKAIIMILMVTVLPSMSYAQFGGLLEKAAKKAVNKTTEKVVDKATDKISDKASKGIENQFNRQWNTKRGSTNDGQTVEAGSQHLTAEDLMRQMPELPTADQLVKHKEAELNDKTVRLMTSKVTIFSARVLELATKVHSIGVEGLDSSRVMAMAKAYTGLTDSEIEQLSQMDDEQQQAWLEQHYSQQRATTAIERQAIDASQWLEPLQPLIDEWSAVSQKVDDVYRDLDTKLQPIYKKYADRLSTADGKERANLLLSYYTEAVPHIRVAVQQALNIRLSEQLPIAEQIETRMKSIRDEHPDAIAQLLNYPQLTATQYFVEVARLTEIPRYDE